MFPQATIEEIIESERSMLVTAKDRYGQYYAHARSVSVFLSRCISAVDHDRMMFGRLHAHMKKHHMLALFSTLRLHKVQAMMDLRQVLEAGASGAFAIANPEQRHFADAGDRGILDPTSELTKKRYAWLNEHYRDKSQWIKDTKERINSSAAHANIVSADSVFRVTDAGDAVSTPFFQEAVREKSRAIHICQQIANGSKHMKIERNPDPDVQAKMRWETEPARVDTLRAGDPLATFQQQLVVVDKGEEQSAVRYSKTHLRIGRGSSERGGSSKERPCRQVDKTATLRL